MDSVRIAQRFRGPPLSGNGGYTCGLLASVLGGTVEATLSKPPPLERTLRLRQSERLELLHDDVLIAQARPAELELSIPPLPDPEHVAACTARYTGFQETPYPECFVCGPARSQGDGLRVFAGRMHAGDPVCAPWTPHASLANDAGEVHSAFVWAALDCPGYFAFGETFVAVLGRMTASLRRTLEAGTECVVLGWKLGSEGRKHYAATALFTVSGELVGCSKQVWIRL